MTDKPDPNATYDYNKCRICGIPFSEGTHEFALSECLGKRPPKPDTPIVDNPPERRLPGESRLGPLEPTIILANEPVGSTVCGGQSTMMRRNMDIYNESLTIPDAFIGQNHTSINIDGAIKTDKEQQMLEGLMVDRMMGAYEKALEATPTPSLLGSPANPSKFKRILVTGAGGFIGVNLVRSLSIHDYKVMGAVKNRVDESWPGFGVSSMHRTGAYVIDLREKSEVDTLIGNFKPEVVIHCAAYGTSSDQNDFDLMIDSNVYSTKNLLDISLAHGVKLFINLGSSSEYGFKTQPMKESDVLEPNSHYAVTKAAQTHLVSLCGKQQSAMKTVTFRLFSVYGPWEDQGRLIPTLLRRSTRGDVLEMANEKLSHDFIYIDDVIDCICLFENIMDHNINGDIFNIGSGIQWTLKEVSSLIKEECCSESKIVYGAISKRSWDSTFWISDPKKTSDWIGWERIHSFDEGLRRTLAWMKEQKLV